MAQSFPGDPWANCPPPTTEDLAIILGYRQGDSPYKLGPRFTNDMEMAMALKTATMNLSALPPNIRDVVYSEFCAKYLPMVVNDFLDPPLRGIKGTGFEDILGPMYCKLLNAWLIMLCSMAHLPYFVKYLRSMKLVAAPGKDLINVVAKRILVLAERLDHMDQSDTNVDGPVVLYFDAFLNSLPLVYSIYSLSSRSKEQGRAGMFRAENQSKLLEYLRRWKDSQHTCRGDVKEFSEIAYELMTTDAANFRQYRVRRREQWGLAKCALPECTENRNLKGCARCKTAFYCSREHQRVHWSRTDPPHRKLCHSTAY